MSLIERHQRLQEIRELIDQRLELILQGVDTPTIHIEVLYLVEEWNDLRFFWQEEMSIEDF